jgi:hypothetical protein
VLEIILGLVYGIEKYYIPSSNTRNEIKQQKRMHEIKLKGQ